MQRLQILWTAVTKTPEYSRCSTLKTSQKTVDPQSIQLKREVPLRKLLLRHLLPRKEQIRFPLIDVVPYFCNTLNNSQLDG